MDQEVSEPAPGPRSRSGKPTRRGPMDEMRQLVRILVKLLPQSIGYIGANEEAGGGNRIRWVGLHAASQGCGRARLVCHAAAVPPPSLNCAATCRLLTTAAAATLTVWLSPVAVS